MAYEMKHESGSLFRNDRKQTDNHPDYTGQALIDGKQYWVSAWLKESQSGKKFFSMSYKPKDDQQHQAAADSQAPDAGGRADLSDEIPF